MYSRTVVIQLEHGLHSKPAGDFTQLANKYRSTVSIEMGERCINAKSLLGVLSLGIAKGSEISIIAAGEDEKEAVEALVKTVL